MKIAHILWSLQIGGGIESMLVDIANEQSFEHEVSIIVINKRYSEYLLNAFSKKVKIELLNRHGRISSLVILMKLIRMMLLEKPDIIHCHQDALYPFVAISSCLLRKKKTILTVHDTNIKLKYVHKYDKIVAISNAVQNDLLKRYNINSTRIYNGIDNRNIFQRVEKLNEVFCIVQIGSLNHRKKGQDLLIRSLGWIKKNRQEIKFQMDFIGRGKSLEYLSELAKVNNLSAEVRFLGARQRAHIYKEICNYCLLVHPSRYEGFGLTIIEAMAARVPVLVSDVDGPLEIVDNGKYGYVFENNNIEDLIEKLLKINALRGSKEQQNIIDMAHSYATNNFSVKCQVKNYNLLYKS